MTVHTSEIAPDLFRFSIYAPEFDLQFNHFLVRDEQPLLYHTGMRGMFPDLREAVARVLDPSTIRWIGYSHFEVDECGALNDWLAVAPQAQAVAGVIGALVNLADFSVRPARALGDGEVLETGKYRFRFQPTPHFPHGWDAGMLFEETQRTLFSSDLFHHEGNPEPLTASDIVGRSRETSLRYQAGPLMDYVPWTHQTPRHLETLAALNPRTIAVMHGSSFEGDGARALRDLEPVFREVFGEAKPVPVR